MKSITLPDGWTVVVDCATAWGPSSAPMSQCDVFQVNMKDGTNHQVTLGKAGGFATAGIVAMSQLFQRVKGLSSDGIAYAVAPITSFNGGSPGSGNPIASRPSTVNMLSDLSYDGSGNLNGVVVVVGTGYLWTPGANDLTIVNGSITYNASDGPQQFTATSSTLSATGTASASVSASMIMTTVQITGPDWLLPQWPKNAQVFIMGSGMPPSSGVACTVLSITANPITENGGGSQNGIPSVPQIITIALPDPTSVANVGDPLNVRDASGDDWFDVAVVDPNTNVASVLSNAAQWNS